MPGPHPEVLMQRAGSCLGAGRGCLPRACVGAAAGIRVQSEVPSADLRLALGLDPHALTFTVLCPETQVPPSWEVGSRPWVALPKVRQSPCGGHSSRPSVQRRFITQ